MTQQATGVDVSHHRGTVNWRDVKASGINFAIVKATDGASFIDNKFDANWLGLRHAGLLRGAYHFYRPATDPHVQAQHYLSQVGDILHTTDLPPVLDCEAYPSRVREEFLAQPLDERLERVRTWLQVVGKATGRTPILYTNPATWQVVLGDDKTFTQYPLWIAHYNVTRPSVPADNWGGHGYTLWQQTYEASVPGINGGVPPVDFNVYKDDAIALNAWAGWSGARPVPPAVTNAEMFLALRGTAETLNIDLTYFLETAGLAYLANHPNRVYNGLAFEELPLPAAQVTLIKELLLGGSGEDIQLLPANFTNQQMINAIYEAATQLEIAGWQLLTWADLTEIVEVRETLYTGPLPDDMAGLNAEQRLTLNLTLGLESAAPADPAPEPEPVPEDPAPEPEPVPEDPTPEPDPIPEDPAPVPDPLPAPYPGKLNQDMINAFYVVAETYQQTGWSLVEQAGMVQLSADRTAEYTGLKIEHLILLSPAQQAELAEALGVVRDGSTFDAPYPGLLNQDMINIFFQAAQQHEAEGWQWVERAQLDYMGKTQTLRYAEYLGPLITNIATLSVDERDTLAAVLAAAA